MNLLKIINKRINRMTDNFTSEYHHNKVILFFLFLVSIICFSIFFFNVVIGVVELFKPNSYPWFIIPGLLFSPMSLWFSYHGARNSLSRLTH